MSTPHAWCVTCRRVIWALEGPAHLLIDHAVSQILPEADSNGCNRCRGCTADPREACEEYARRDRAHLKSLTQPVRRKGGTTPAVFPAPGTE